MRRSSPKFWLPLPCSILFHVIVGAGLTYWVVQKELPVGEVAGEQASVLQVEIPPAAPARPPRARVDLNAPASPRRILAVVPEATEPRLPPPPPASKPRPLPMALPHLAAEPLAEPPVTKTDPPKAQNSRPSKPTSRSVAKAKASPPRQSAAAAGMAHMPTGAGKVSSAAYKRQAPLVYPPEARRKGWQGVVKLRIWVETDGSAGQIRVVSSSGFDSLDQAALRCAQNSRYLPPTKDHKPIAAWVEASFRFQL